MVRDLQGTREAVDQKLAASRIRMFGRGGDAGGDDYGDDMDDDVSADESDSEDEGEEAGSSYEGSSAEEGGVPWLFTVLRTPFIEHSEALASISVVPNGAQNCPFYSCMLGSIPEVWLWNRHRRENVLLGLLWGLSIWALLDTSSGVVRHRV